jgi:hypothetical protein
MAAVVECSSATQRQSQLYAPAYRLGKTFMRFDASMDGIQAEPALGKLII